MFSDAECEKLVEIASKFLETREYDNFFYRDIEEFSSFELTLVAFLLKNDIIAFTKWIFFHVQGQEFHLQPFHYKIFDALMEVYKGNTTGLIINMPPGYSKTEICSKIFPAWCYYRHVNIRFLILSYSTPNAFEISETVKKYLKPTHIKGFAGSFGNDLYFSKTTDGKETWKIGDIGEFRAFSAAGPVTGNRASFIDEAYGKKYRFKGAIIIDDPIKPMDALSEAILNSVNANWSLTIKSRRATDRTPVICIMQRLCTGDYTDMLKADVSIKWKNLVIPAINEQGEPLWTKKDKLDYLNDMKINDPETFNAQYMQKPIVASGNIIKRTHFKDFDDLPEGFEKHIVVSDTAIKAGTYNDYTVFMHAGIYKGNVYILDVEQFKATIPEMERRAVDFYNTHSSILDLSTNGFYVEDKGSGSGLIQRFKEFNLKVRSVPRITSKIVRLHDVLPYLAEGCVYLPKEAHWKKSFISECLSFSRDDTHKHDDQVDCLMDVLDILKKQGSCRYAF